MFFLIAIVRDEPSMDNKKFKIDKKALASVANSNLSTPKILPEKVSEKGSRKLLKWRKKAHQKEKLLRNLHHLLQRKKSKKGLPKDPKATAKEKEPRLSTKEKEPRASTKEVPSKEKLSSIAAPKDTAAIASQPVTRYSSIFPAAPLNLSTLNPISLIEGSASSGPA